MGDNTAERPMWAEKGGLDFEGRARWDAWTAVKASTARTTVSEQSKGDAAGCMCTSAVSPGGQPSPAQPRSGVSLLSASHFHEPLRLVVSVAQGMATAKAKLEFVRAYYEFSPKSLYKDERGAAAEKKEGA